MQGKHASKYVWPASNLIQFSMALVLPNSIFFHLPKTGGTFVRETIQDLGIVCEEIDEVHINPIRFSAEYSDIAKDKFTFTFIRHPLSWWQSYWRHRMETGWSFEHPMDLECRHNDFTKYMEQILSSRWKFHYHDVCHQFLSEEMNFVGRQENLVDDLQNALRHAGEKFDGLSVGRLGRINATSSKKAQYTRQVRREVIDIHGEFIRRYYPQTKSYLGRLFTFGD